MRSLPLNRAMRATPESTRTSDSQIIGAPSWNVASGGTENFFFGYWVGDYFGIAGTPRGFAVAAVQGTPLSDGPAAAPITGLNSVVVGQVVSGDGG